MDTLETLHCFVTAVNLIKKPEFLASVISVAEENLVCSKEHSEECHLHHTQDISRDARIEEFAAYVGATGWNILKEQGYKMDNRHVFFESMWCQEYEKKGFMPQHVHPNNGAQLVGFYFLDCSEDSSFVTLHDPRPGKVQISLEEDNKEAVTHGSNTILLKPEPGLLLFTNAWLPHSFTQNKSDKPFKFIHFNIGVQEVAVAPTAPLPQQAEII